MVSTRPKTDVIVIMPGINTYRIAFKINPESFDMKSESIRYRTCPKTRKQQNIGSVFQRSFGHKTVEITVKIRVEMSLIIVLEAYSHIFIHPQNMERISSSL